jgi:hypothetical protein
MKYISITGEWVAVCGDQMPKFCLLLAYRFHLIARLKYVSLHLPSLSLSTWKTKDDYVDAYLRVIKNADPLRTSLVFSCGMGAVRTTFAMTAACLVRRRQLMLRGLPDPYVAKLLGSSHPSNSASGVNTVSQDQFLLFSLLTPGD